jgi:hypothetical protein
VRSERASPVRRVAHPAHHIRAGPRRIPVGRTFPSGEPTRNAVTGQAPTSARRRYQGTGNAFAAVLLRTRLGNPAQSARRERCRRAKARLRPKFDDYARFLGHRERNAAIVLGEGVRVEVRVDLLGDGDAGVAQDLGELEDVAAGREEQAGERVAHIVDAELLGQSGSEGRCLEGTEHTRLVARELLSNLVALRARPQQSVLAFESFISRSTDSTESKIGTWRSRPDFGLPRRPRWTWITRWTRSTSTHARCSASSSRRPVPTRTATRVLMLSLQALRSFWTSPADWSQVNGRSATSRSSINRSGFSEHQPCSTK